MKDGDVWEESRGWQIVFSILHIPLLVYSDTLAHIMRNR